MGVLSHRKPLCYLLLHAVHAYGVVPVVLFNADELPSKTVCCNASRT